MTPEARTPKATPTHTGNGPSSEAKKKLDVYTWTVAAIGWPVILYSLYQLRADLSWTLGILAALAIAASALGVRLPLSGRGAGQLTVTVSDCFTFIAFLLMGPHAGVAVATADGLAGNARILLSRFQRFLFNVAQVGLSAAAAAHLFWMLQESVPPLSLDLSALLPSALRIGVAALLYFGLNAAFISTAIGISSGYSAGLLMKRLTAKLGPVFCLNIAAAMLPLNPLPQAVIIIAGLLLLLASRMLSLRVDPLKLTAEPR